MRHHRRIALFLVLVAVPTTVLNVLLLRIGDVRGSGAMPIMFALMWVPAIAALIANRGPRGLGWRLGAVRWLALAYALTFAIVTIPFLVAIATGNATVTMAWWPSAAGNWGLPATPLAGFLMLATVNVLFASIPALGEELGWRGFLVPALAERHGFAGVVAISWGVTLLYHLPAIVGAGYRAEATPLWFSLACFAAMLLPLCAFMAWLRLRSGSVWPCVLAHGAHNAFVQEMWPSAIQSDALTPWLVGEFGALTALTAFAVVGGLLVATRATPLAMPRLSPGNAHPA